MLVNKIVLVKQKMCRGTNDAGIYYLANCKGVQRCIHLCTVCFVDSFKLETIISPSHYILLVSFVSPSVLEYNDSKCKMKLC